MGSKEKQREKKRRWVAAHQEEYKATLSEYKTKNTPYEEIADEPEKVYKTPEQMYCANYRADELSCLQCYENQTAIYKACHKRG